MDSDRFGINVARVDDFDCDLNELMSELRKHKIEFVISKVDSSNISLINQLEDLGFRLKDTQITYRYLLDKDPPKIDQKGIPGLEIDSFRMTYLDSIKEIASMSFENYGHYAVDKKLANHNIGEIYSDWAERSCLESHIADKVFVAKIEDEVVGFVCIKILESDEAKYAEGTLGAVSPNFRGQGIIKLLINATMKWSFDMGLEWVEHNVITTNYAINSAFSPLGFKVYKSHHTFHCWL